MGSSVSCASEDSVPVTRGSELVLLEQKYAAQQQTRSARRPRAFSARMRHKQKSKASPEAQYGVVPKIVVSFYDPNDQDYHVTYENYCNSWAAQLILSEQGTGDYLMPGDVTSVCHKKETNPESPIHRVDTESEKDSRSDSPELRIQDSFEWEDDGLGNSADSNKDFRSDNVSVYSDYGSDRAISPGATNADVTCTLYSDRISPTDHVSTPLYSLQVGVNHQCDGDKHDNISNKHGDNNSIQYDDNQTEHLNVVSCMNRTTSPNCEVSDEEPENPPYNDCVMNYSDNLLHPNYKPLKSIAKYAVYANEDLPTSKGGFRPPSGRDSDSLHTFVGEENEALELDTFTSEQVASARRELIQVKFQLLLTFCLSDDDRKQITNVLHSITTLHKEDHAPLQELTPLDGVPEMESLLMQHTIELEAAQDEFVKWLMANRCTFVYDDVQMLLQEFLSIFDELLSRHSYDIRELNEILSVEKEYKYGGRQSTNVSSHKNETSQQTDLLQDNYQTGKDCEFIRQELLASLQQLLKIRLTLTISEVIQSKSSVDVIRRSLDGLDKLQDRVMTVEGFSTEHRALLLQRKEETLKRKVVKFLVAQLKLLVEGHVKELITAYNEDTIKMKRWQTVENCSCTTEDLMQSLILVINKET